MRWNGQRRQRPGWCRLQKLGGDASGVRCGRASLPLMTVATGYVTSKDGRPATAESHCAATISRIATNCEAVRAGVQQVGSRHHRNCQQHQGLGDRRGWQGGGWAAVRWGSPRPNAPCFSEVCGIPAQMRHVFTGWLNSMGVIYPAAAMPCGCGRDVCRWPWASC